MEAELRKEGWSLSDKGLEYCKSLSTNKDPSRREIITNALHTDLRQIGKQCLPADINRAKNTMIEGPIVLQIQKIRNVSAPNAKEDSSFAPRMLKLSMTDGVMSCTGLELETVNAISLLTPSGSKICLTGKLAVHNGFILLTERNVKLIGGNVDHLKAKWELSTNVNKLQRKVLAADGGPPLFVPFENSEFSRRKPPTASSTTKTSEPKQPPNRERPAMQTEKVTKPFEDKKIWKSDPLKAKKDKSSKFGKDTFSGRSQDQKGAGEKGDRISNTNTEGRKSTEKEKQQDRYQQGKNLKVGSKKGEEETSRHAAQNSKKDSIKNAQKEDRMAVKDQGEEVKSSEKQKYRNGGKSEFEEKKLWNKQERNVRSRQETTRPKSGGREEKPGNNFQDLPPRMERLKQQKSSDVKEDRNKVSETRKEGKTGEKNSKNAKIDAKEIEDKEISGKPDDKDMERVIGLLNEKMRMDEGRGAGMGDDRQKRSRYENTRYVDRSRGQVETEHKKYGKEEASRSTMDHSAPAKYEQRNGERLGQRGQGRGRYGGQGRGSQRGGFSYRNGRYDSGGYDPSHGDVRKNQMESIDGEGVRGLEANVRSGNFGRNPGQSENGNNGLMRENSGQVTNLEAEKPDKVAQFMSAVVANSGKGMQGDLMANMQRQAFGNQNIAQQSVPQAMVTSSDSMMYNYLTTYPTAMFQPSANQPYHPMHSQNFQRGGYQGNMQSLSAMNQYQQMPPVSQMPPMSQMAPMSQVPPMPAMYYQGMGPPQQNMGFRGQPPGFGARGKPRVKHDVYRPKTE